MTRGSCIVSVIDSNEGLIHIVAERAAPTAYPAPGSRVTITLYELAEGESPLVMQRFYLDYSVAGASDVGWRHEQFVINSSDSGAANLEVYVRCTDMSENLVSSRVFPSPRTRTNEPVFPRVTLSVRG